MLVVNLSKAKHILYPKNICDFRAYKVAITNENWQNRIDGFQIASNGIDNANLIVSDLSNDVMRDKPDLIMYDKGNLCARFSIDYFINEYKKNNLLVNSSDKGSLIKNFQSTSI